MQKHYFVLKDGSHFLQFTKEEIYEQIDNSKPETFLPFLEMMDYPYIEHEWQKMVDRFPGGLILGRYLSLMRLKGFRGFTYADSDWLNEVRQK